MCAVISEGCLLSSLSQPVRVVESDRISPDPIMIRSGWQHFIRSGIMVNPIRSEPDLFRIGSGRISYFAHPTDPWKYENALLQERKKHPPHK